MLEALEPAFTTAPIKEYHGALEAPQDYRDYILDDIVGSSPVNPDNLPREFMVRNIDLKNQGQNVSCTTFATYHASEATIEFVKNINVTTDPHKGWELQKTLGTHGPNGDFVQTALRSAVQHGIHTTDGKVYDVEGWAAVTALINDPASNTVRIKQRLIEGYGLITSYDIAKNTSAGARAGRLPFPDGPRLTGHAVCIKGWNEEGFIIGNSYGPTWGAFKDGTFIVPYDRVYLLKTVYVLFAKPKAAMIFPDVSELSPHASSIKKVKDLGLMTGTDEGRFEPERPVTRRELAIVMDRLLTHLNK